MPEHIHLLISEPPACAPSRVMQVLKQRVARSLRHRNRKSATQMPLSSDNQPPSFCQRRFYDFNVWSKKKRIEKLNYMHINPVKRGLATHPKCGCGAVTDFISMRNEDSVLLTQRQDHFKTRTLCQNRKECATRPKRPT